MQMKVPFFKSLDLTGAVFVYSVLLLENSTDNVINNKPTFSSLLFQRLEVQDRKATAGEDLVVWSYDRRPPTTEEREMARERERARGAAHAHDAEATPVVME